MKKFFINIILLALALACAWASIYYFSGKSALVSLFASGVFSGIFLMNLLLNVKNDKIISYKRALEKEAISSTESDARVKVLESKIEVLEKALENALKG